MFRRVAPLVGLALLALFLVWSRTRDSGRGRGALPLEEAPRAGTDVELQPASAPVSDAASTDAASVSTRHEAEPRSAPTLTGRVVAAPGVVLLPGETLDGHEIEWLPPPKLTPRFDARGNELAPFETFGAVGGEATLAADGRFEFAPVTTGKELTLRVSGELGEAEVLCAPLAAGERREVELPFGRGTLEWNADVFPLRWVSGRIVDEYGQPAAGVEVHLSLAPHWGDFAQQAIETDEVGAFLFDAVPPDRVRVWVERDAGDRIAVGGALDRDAGPSDVRDLELCVSRGKVLEGRVLWPDGTEVERFLAHLQGFNPISASGSFRFEAISDEEGELVLFADAGTRTGLWHGRVRPDGTISEYVLEEQAPCALSIEVVGPDGGPVAALVRLEPVRWPRLADWAPSKSAGRRLRLSIPPGEARLSVQAFGFLTHEELVHVEGSRDLRVVLQPAGFVRGVVLAPNGEAVEASKVRFPWDDRTVEDGRFELRPPERETLLYALADGFGHSEPVRISLGTGETVEGLVLRLRPRCSLVGELVEPLAYTTVIVESGGVRREVHTERGGVFRLDAPPGRGEAWILFDDRREGPHVAFELVAEQETRVVVPLR